MTTLGVVGTGTMGSGIAQVAAQHGLEVVLVDAQPELAQRARERIATSLQQAVQRGRLSGDEAEAALERLTPAGGMDALAMASWVIEAVPEEISLKRAVFAQLEQVCPPGTILASNTSSLSVSE
ncbi:MAG TPA: 3-hydroxyacyl-CoA dehydrogenase NAD-binding domain-containing protein, partial [Chloroflexota bacterium]